MTGSRAPVLMVQGTASHVGKSTLTAAICRILRQDGLRVAPFKAQNMALNAYVAVEGGEIGRSQALQAQAAGVDASVDMNPILLKPEADARSQVIVAGRPIGSLGAAEYQRLKPSLWPTVADALDRLRAGYDIVVAEGAGSPAEVNLKHADLTNMRVARHAQAAVLLVGDIDRGGVFASLLGTLELLDPEERALVRGLAINKFRGDRSILEPGLAFLEARTGVPVLGVLPFLHGLDLPEEDSLGLSQPCTTHDGPSSVHRADLDSGSSGSVGKRLPGRLDVAVIRLPHIANFDEFGPLAAEPAVALRYVERAPALGVPDLIVLPGTKTTADDLDWLHGSGIAAALLALARRGTPVLGICGGFQMLGRSIHDPAHAESHRSTIEGLGLLPIVTTFAPTKRTVRVRGTLAARHGPFAGAAGTSIQAYEIHQGRTDLPNDLSPLATIQADPPAPSDEQIGPAQERTASMPTDGHDGVVSADGSIVGTYLHGLLENDAPRHALIDWLLARAPTTGRVAPSLDLAVRHRHDLDRQLNALAAAVRASLDVGPLLAACGIGSESASPRSDAR
ncbi:MAG: cobyric acid synthase [Chloroflexi bacterium]|nr:cobyric acid synthase [Chloroflexota bacterium]